jgi:histidyl-tRNA synthetase
MTEEKGLDPAVADKIGEYVNFKGGEELLSKLEKDATLSANADAKKGLEDMAKLFTYLKIFGVLDKVSLDMSLARGLDYVSSLPLYCFSEIECAEISKYTGVIYEVVTEGSAPPAATNPDGQKPAKSKKKPATNGADDDRSNDPTVGVGSVAAGGRYDELVGMFSGKQQIPCVGISFGVDRKFNSLRCIQPRLRGFACFST